MTLSEKEWKLIGLLQDDFPLVKRPFLILGEECGLTEAQILETLKKWQSSGMMRKLGVALRHGQVGYQRNILVVWAVPSEKVDRAGMLFAEKKWVSHCYEREPPYLGRYNLFTMIHLPPGGREGVIEHMARESGIHDYLALETVEELKKTSMKYY